MIDSNPYSHSNYLLRGQNVGPLVRLPFVLPSKTGYVLQKHGPDLYKFACGLTGLDEAIEQEALSDFCDYLYFKALYDPKFVLPVVFNGSSIGTKMVTGSGVLPGSIPGPFRQFKYMIVGKCPTERDVAMNSLASSVNVKYTMGFLENRGIDPADCYVTSVVKHALLDPSSTTLKAAWIANCMPILKLEILLVRPDFILLMGDEAVKAVLGREHKLSNSSGKVFDINIPNDDETTHTAKAITCVSPSFVLRYPENIDRFKFSINHFSAVTKGEEFMSSEKDTRHFAVRDSSELEAVRDEILSDSNPVVAVDLEWSGGWPTDKGAYVRTLQLSWKSKVACSIVVHKAGGGFTFGGGPAKLKEILNSIFKPADGRHVRVVGHYLTADLPWLESLGVDLGDLFEAPADDDVSVPVDKYEFGFEKTKNLGGFDTLLAAHSVNETDIFNLEEQAVARCGMARWEGPLIDWKKNYCKDNSIKESELDGYGSCPDEVIIPYGCWDADSTRRLYDFYNGVGDAQGALDSDKLKNNCRLPFWISARAYPAFIEMRKKGIAIDVVRMHELMDLYSKLYEGLLHKLRGAISWPDFNPSSPFQNRELLFGEALSGKLDVDGNPVRQRPEGAMTVSIKPYKSTGTGAKGKIWEDLEARGLAHMHTASADKETLTILADQHPVVAMLRDVRALHYVRTTVLRAADVDADGNYIADDEGNTIYEKGLLSYLSDDGRVRSMFSQSKETGRASSSKPNLQNLGKTIEEKYKGIFTSHGKDLGLDYTYPLRSVIGSRPGHVLVEADYVGAELAIMAWQSGDKKMIEHVRRANLPESHADYYDIHSNVAVSTFRLTCPPTKKGLKDCGKGGLRTAAKAVVFGYAYGQGADSTARKAKQEGVIISVQEAQELIDGLVAMYPMLPLYFSECKRRVISPGWIRNAFGRYRRFPESHDRVVIAEYERQSMNFPIQSAVADAVSMALDHIYTYRKTAKPGMTYDIILQVHDAVLLEVPYECVEWVIGDVLPTCMSKMVSINSCKLDGRLREGDCGPYNLGIATEVFTKWSIPLTLTDCKTMGIPERFSQH